jgi:hypothetical protein
VIRYVSRPRAAGPNGGAEEQQPHTGLQHAAIRLEDCEVEFPMALHLCLGLTAQPDVQLQLVSVRTGSEARRKPASGHSTFPKADSEWQCCVLGHHTVNTATADTPRSCCCACSDNLPGWSAGALVLAKNAATLGFLGLLFPDAAGPWLRNMAVAGAVSSVFMAGRRSAQKRGWSLRRPSLCINLRENGALYNGMLPVAAALHCA